MENKIYDLIVYDLNDPLTQEVEQVETPSGIELKVKQRDKTDLGFGIFDRKILSPGYSHIEVGRSRSSDNLNIAFEDNFINKKISRYQGAFWLDSHGNVYYQNGGRNPMVASDFRGNDRADREKDLHRGSITEIREGEGLILPGRNYMIVPFKREETN